MSDKADWELKPCELLAKNKIPPIDATSLDFDSALTLWRQYPEQRHRLRRDLSPHDERVFQRLLQIDEQTLERYWPRAKG